MKKIVVLLLVLASAVAAYFFLDLGRYFDIAFLKERERDFAAYYDAHPARAIGIYFLVYVAVTALSIPGATVVTLAGGALFGLAMGTLLVSFASATGATFAFLASRHLLRGWVRGHFNRQFDAIDEGVRRDGVFYLLTLRLMPVFPFFMVNLLMGLTTMPVHTFYWGNQLGMLAGTLVFVNAGTQLAGIDSLGDVASPAVLASFAALGLFPLLAKWGINAWRQRKVSRS